MALEGDKSPTKAPEHNDDNGNDDPNHKKANPRKRTKTGCLSMYSALIYALVSSPHPTQSLT